MVASTTQLARDAGFVIIDEVQTAYAHLPWEELAVAEWDDHPNAKGHALIAERTLEAIVARESEIWRAAPSQVAEEIPDAETMESIR
ncbi:MAG: hypothetical protein FJ091_19805 [Deltaproteobacteria bacterium]|nr:hypothetical protein [Deltaproteobacteria bacterium]